MFLDSLNNLNFKKQYHTGMDRKMAGSQTALPTIIIFIMVCLPFIAVFNNDLFQAYFYDGYGYSLSVIGILVALMAFIISRKLVIPIENFKILAYIVLTCAYCFFSAVLVGGGYRYIGVVLNTMGTVVLLNYCKIPRFLIKTVFVCLIISAIYGVFTIGGYYASQIKGESVNSNYIALFGVVVLIYGNTLLTYLRKQETWKTQLVRIALCAVSFYIIWECQSRGALLAWMFYLICVYILPSDIFRKKKTVTWIAVAIAICGVLLTYIYVAHLNSFVSTFMGKSTATRFRLWSYFWNTIFQNSKNTILGYGTHSALREAFGYGLHNIYIGIWYDVGIIGYLLFMGFIIITLRSVFDDGLELSIPQIYVIVGFLSFMISDFFAITFTGPMVIWNYALLGLIRKSDCSISSIK